jgi:putative transposase
MVQGIMKDEGKLVSISQLCRWFGLARSTFYYHPQCRRKRTVDRELESIIGEIIDANPGYGLRMITAIVRNRYHIKANRKKIHRIIKLNSWQVLRKPKGHRPRVKGWSSRTDTTDTRWAIDTTHIFCGYDGWCHLTAIIDCCDRSIVGWRLSRSGIAKIAASALEDALRYRRILSKENNLCIRSDNGLVFGAKAFTKVVNQYKIEQEFITPYSAEQNGMIERFFRTIKEECIWLNRFKSCDEAFVAISEWMDKYYKERPHSALNYLTPAEFREKLAA